MEIIVRPRHDVRVASRFFSDDPIDGSQTAPDLLGRQKYVQHLVGLLNAVHTQSESSVLALIGPWGSGKSSVLTMAIETLKRDHGSTWLIAEFNPWMHPDLESMLAGFFGELRQALPDDGKWGEARKRIGAFGKSISPLGSLTSLVGVDGSGIAEMLSGWVSGDTSVTAMKKQAEDSLRKIDRPVLMVLDDLDRLTPHELLLTFKLVRLLGRLPNIYYLLCYDEQTLIDVLGRTDLVGDSDQRPQEYLEKMVQIRLDLPPLREAQSDQLFTTGINTVLEQRGSDLTPQNVNRIAQAYQAYMKTDLETPRTINRFFAQVAASLVMVHGEVDVVDFMLITFLRTAEPQVYELIRKSRAKLTGTERKYSMDRQKQPKEVLADWEKKLKTARNSGDDVMALLEYLGVLFAPIDAAARNQGPSPAHYEDILLRRGVGHIDYFDRYFNFGVPDEDIADSMVIAALEELRTEEDGGALTQLKERLVNDTARVVRKVGIYRRNEHGDAQRLLGLLAEGYVKVPDSPDVFAEDPGRSLVSLGRDLLSDIEPGEVVATLRSASRGDRQLQFIARTIDPRRFTENETPAWLVEARDAVVQLIKARLEEDGDLASLDGVTDAAFSLFWIWARIDPSGVKSWLKDQLDSERWRLIDVIARFATVGVTLSGRPAQTVMGGFSLKDADQLLGLDYIYDQLGQQITDVVTEANDFTVNPTLADRRDFALVVLRNARSRMSTGESK